MVIRCGPVWFCVRSKTDHLFGFTLASILRLPWPVVPPARRAPPIRWPPSGRRRPPGSVPPLLRHTGPGPGLAGHRRRPAHADLRADRLRQDARRVPVVPRPADERTRAGRSAAPPARALRVAAQGARARRRSQPALAARRDRAGRAQPRAPAREVTRRRCARATRRPRSGARLASSRRTSWSRRPSRYTCC